MSGCALLGTWVWGAARLYESDGEPMIVGLE